MSKDADQLDQFKFNRLYQGGHNGEGERLAKEANGGVGSTLQIETAGSQLIYHAIALLHILDSACNIIIFNDLQR
jgi:hypothetical protein